MPVSSCAFYGSVRRSATADYRVKGRIFGTAAVSLSFSQFSISVETTLGSELQISSLTYVAGTFLNVQPGQRGPARQTSTRISGQPAPPSPAPGS